MKRIVSILMMVLLVIPALGTTAHAGNTVKAKVTESSTYFDGEERNINGFNISNNNYFRLRDLAEYFIGTPSQFNITWNKASNAIEIITGQAYTPEKNMDSKYYDSYRSYPATLSSSKVLVNGQLQSITAYNIDNNNYVQLRDLASKIPFDIDFDVPSNRISLTSKVPDHAYRVKTAGVAQSNLETSNYPTWKRAVTSYLVNNNDGTVSVIEANKEVTIETYNDKHELTSNKSIPLELPTFGAFYSGEKYNYIAYGQDNVEENNSKEVIRIVRYDKSFNRIDSVSITGGQSYTTHPFDAAAGRMAESGDTLVFHTSRERYTTADGLNHQSQLTIIVNTRSMTVTNDTGEFQKNHVSHSFDQYVMFDGNAHVLVDHGDAYPRSVVLNKGDGTSYNEVDLFRIPGETGENYTGVSIGGFEMSSANYIVAMNSVDHSLSKASSNYEIERFQRDVMLSVLPKANLSEAAVNNITLAKYVGTGRFASIPKLVKITDDKLMVMWQEFNEENLPSDLKYVYINGTGQITGEIQTKQHFNLSQASPIVSGNKVIWYSNSNGSRIFYTIDL